MKNIFSISNELGVDFYKRAKRLGSPNTKSDEVIYDFIDGHKDADIVVWVNPIAPFQNGQEINKIVNYFVDEKLDSLISTETNCISILIRNQLITPLMNHFIKHKI